MHAVVVSLGDAAFVIIRLPIAGRFFHRKGIFGRLAGIRIVGPRAPSQRPVPVEPRVGDATWIFADKMFLRSAAERGVDLPIEISPAGQTGTMTVAWRTP